MAQNEGQKWADKCTLDKILSVGQVTAVIAIFAVIIVRPYLDLQIGNVTYITIPLLVVMYLCMSLQYRKQSKRMVKYLLFAAFFLILSIIDICVGI